MDVFSLSSSCIPTYVNKELSLRLSTCWLLFSCVHSDTPSSVESERFKTLWKPESVCMGVLEMCQVHVEIKCHAPFPEVPEIISSCFSLFFKDLTLTNLENSICWMLYIHCTVGQDNVRLCK